ncbi:MAG: EF-hand domain-containing protein [Methylococcales symbiont of Hymedesmia sp. n. MRB-2018]|nr:MAG: EF-hand domain-containing protein [Methylococcales symbiont of Hymedesmia sp. n. MRB-2018]KAF3982864.1 MAG: EF-hand domain-containing protein [Methylococcales symbiont of Hymedesmia sp. n. MRB-2018]
MKKLAKPLIVSALLITSVGVYAQGYSGYKVKKIISTMDDNADSKVNYKEFIEQTVTDNKDPLDTNQDGYITAGEIVIEITEDLIETIKEMRKQGVSEADINKTIAKELHTAEKEAEAMISKMDIDHDNLVEPEEFDAFNRKQFNALDKNQDGVISQKDIKRKKGYPIHWY